jgi:CheY-like chemotaxis protein
MNKPLILVVEDDIPVRNLITITLKTHGYRYLTAGTGDGAVVEASSHNPDVVLLDLGLPDMDGVDVIAFTAGLGENGKSMRKAVCEHLSYLGIKIDDEANSVRGKDIVISTPDSKVKVMVIPTNEELAIARPVIVQTTIVSQKVPVILI